MSLNSQILAGSLLGIGLGGLFVSLGSESVWTAKGLYLCQIISSVFINLLKMLLVPLVFTSIVTGVANLRLHSQLHRVWKLTLMFFVVSMMLAIMQGLLAANLFAPGKGQTLELLRQASPAIPAKTMTLGEFAAAFIAGLFVNPFAALAQGNLLAIVVFALLLGAALVAGGERYRNILLLLQESMEVLLSLLGWIMKLAPYGILALLAQLLATQDVLVLASLTKFVVIIIATTLIHGLLVLPLLLWLLTGVTPQRFFAGARQALVTALATSSSSATLPVTLRCMEQHLHVKPEIAGFVIPLGATINMDGSALYEAAAALFVANLTGIELDLGQQLIVCFTSLVAAIGAPGIPSAGMVTMVMVLQAVGLPTEAIAILLPVDRLLDTVRTMVNVEGDMVASLVVQRWTSDK